jgi:hypothetical protein
MNQEAILWIFGTIITIGTIITGAMAGAVLNLKERVVRIETTFSLFNEKAATILHSPHTPELDAALEELLASYDKNRDMTQEQWTNLLRLVEQIENDKELAKGERLIAAMVSTTCRVKLGMTPPGYRHTL